jgi:hypothetical protein
MMIESVARLYYRPEESPREDEHLPAWCTRLFNEPAAVYYSLGGTFVRMFCPNCGKSEQAPDSYCRSCGEYLVDPASKYSLVNRVLGISRPEKQFNVTLAIDLVTSIVSGFLVVFLMGYFDGRYRRTGQSAPPIVYLVYLFLGLVSAWQLLSFIIGLKLRTKLGGAKRTGLQARQTPNAGTSTSASAQAALPDVVQPEITPLAVTEETTRKLDKIRR